MIPTEIFREVFTGFIVFSSYAVAITCVTPVKEQKKELNLKKFSKGGFYIFNLLETYAAGLSLLVTVFAEAIAVSWFYGLR